MAGCQRMRSVINTTWQYMQLITQADSGHRFGGQPLPLLPFPSLSLPSNLLTLYVGIALARQHCKCHWSYLGMLVLTKPGQTPVLALVKAHSHLILYVKMATISVIQAEIWRHHSQMAATTIELSSFLHLCFSSARRIYVSAGKCRVHFASFFVGTIDRKSQKPWFPWFSSFAVIFRKCRDLPWFKLLISPNSSIFAQ